MLIRGVQCLEALNLGPERCGEDACSSCALVSIRGTPRDNIVASRTVASLRGLQPLLPNITLVGMHRSS